MQESSTMRLSDLQSASGAQRPVISRGQFWKHAQPHTLKHLGQFMGQSGQGEY